MYLTTRGLVLRTTEYKETDRILTILTDHDGLLSVKARGVRSNRSKLKGACQLLTYAEFTISDARGFTAITEATAIEMFPELRNDLLLLSLASYFAQLAEVLSQEDASSPALLSLILNALYALSKLKKPPRLVKARRSCGWPPSRAICRSFPAAVCAAGKTRTAFHRRRDAGMRRLPRVRRSADAAVSGVAGGDAVHRLLPG